ncbi:MAG: hypothetical protein ACFB11_24030 [Paracoccaceae bacterium]
MSDSAKQFDHLIDTIANGFKSVKKSLSGAPPLGRYLPIAVANKPKFAHDERAPKKGPAGSKSAIDTEFRTQHETFFQRKDIAVQHWIRSQRQPD